MIKFSLKSSIPLMICSLSLKAEAVVIYTDIPDTGVFGFLGDEFFDVDLNQDNTVDFRFRSNFDTSGFVILPQNQNTAFSSPIPLPPDINTFAKDFNNGELIGPSVLGDNLVLLGQRFGISGREIGAGLLSCALFSEVVCLGEFDTAEAQSGGDPTDFVGVALDLSGNTHFGYIEILSSGFNGGTIVSFAYETEPNQSIFAGAIPEPSTALLGALATSFLIYLRRRS